MFVILISTRKTTSWVRNINQKYEAKIFFKISFLSNGREIPRYDYQLFFYQSFNFTASWRFDKIFRKIMLWWNCQITSWYLNPWQRMFLTYMLHNNMHGLFIRSFVPERSAANKLGWALNRTLAAIQISRCKYRWLSFLFERWCFKRISWACPVVTWTSGNEPGVQKLFSTTI